MSRTVRLPSGAGCRSRWRSAEFRLALHPFAYIPNSTRARDETHLRCEPRSQMDAHRKAIGRSG